MSTTTTVTDVPSQTSTPAATADNKATPAATTTTATDKADLPKVCKTFVKSHKLQYKDALLMAAPGLILFGMPSFVIPQRSTVLTILLAVQLALLSYHCVWVWQHRTDSDTLTEYCVDDEFPLSLPVLMGKVSDLLSTTKTDTTTTK